MVICIIFLVWNLIESYIFYATPALTYSIYALLIVNRINVINLHGIINIHVHLYVSIILGQQDGSTDKRVCYASLMTCVSKTGWKNLLHEMVLCLHLFIFIIPQQQ